ncbi:MAG TPA: efflux RND transporter periplasmic adaptor subunit [Verrucomicrobiae bacterium]|jgi:RND family efflux transporter MFP subunit|nr:efflux RND transporter periplasmic adaptor subunit [Verrucomicrobiae bacterium]
MNTKNPVALAEPVPGGIEVLPAAEERRPGSGASLGRIGLVLLLLVVVGVVAGYLPRARHRTALIAETRELSLPTVGVALPKPSQLAETLLLPAEIKAFVEAPIYARANGYVKRWLVDLGAEVKAGQLLAEIDTPELNQELAQARAQLLQAQAALDLAKTTTARWADLLKTSSVSEQEAAEKQADFALKQATVEAAGANVHRLEEMLSFSKVLAPFDGIITARRVDLGDLIQANSGREMFHLSQTKTLRVFAHVPQNLAHGVTVGQTAEVLIPEIPHETFKAHVVRTSGAMMVDSRTLVVELELPNPKGEILAGSFAQVRFPEAISPATLVVPGNAVIFRSEGTQLAVVHDGQVELHKVLLGRDHGFTVEVLSGIAANDSVMLNPPDSLVDGMKVRVATKSSAEK